MMAHEGQPEPFLFAALVMGEWFVFRQAHRNATDAIRIAGPFSLREEAEAILGPRLQQIEEPHGTQRG